MATWRRCGLAAAQIARQSSSVRRRVTIGGWAVVEHGRWRRCPRNTSIDAPHGRFVQRQRHFATKMARSHEGKWRRGRLVKDGGSARWFRCEEGGGVMMWDECRVYKCIQHASPNPVLYKLSRFCCAVPGLTARGYPRIFIHDFMAYAYY